MFTRILVPLDGTAESNAALPLARTVARATGGSITLLRVLSEDDGIAVATETLEHIAHELTQSGVQVSAVVHVGEAADEILQEVSEQRADLIIMRTHGRWGVGR